MQLSSDSHKRISIDQFDSELIINSHLGSGKANFDMRWSVYMPNILPIELEVEKKISRTEFFSIIFSRLYST